MFYNKTNSWANPVLEIMGSFKELKPQAEKKESVLHFTLY